MHKNRALYTLTEYQRKLRRNYESLGLVCENTANGSFQIFRPIPATPWLPEGRKKYFRRLRSRLQNCNNQSSYTFCTLTYSLRYHTPVSASARIKRDIDLFFKRLNYRRSKPEYFYIIELTDKMMVHIHLIFDRYVHKKKIFKSWNKITQSVCTRVKHLGAKQAFYYCTKYLSDALKQADGKWSFLFKHIDRLWSSSRNFFPSYQSELTFYKLAYIIRTDRPDFFQYIDLPDKSGSSGQFSGHVEQFLREYCEDHELFCSLRRSPHACLPAVGAAGRGSQLYFPFFSNSQLN